MKIEVFQNDKFVKRLEYTLNDSIQISNELMYVPSLSLSLPIIYEQYLKNRPQLKLYLTDEIIFFGWVESINLNKVEETMEVDVSHIVREWEYRQIGTNIAVKNKTLSQLYKDLEFLYSNDWNMVYGNTVDNETIDYVYSRQNKLDGLTTTVEMTENLFWRVGFDGTRRLEVGEFGKKQQHKISILEPSEHNSMILGEVDIINDFSSVVNVATVYSQKSDTGMSSMSLREVFERPSMQLPEFPVVILREGINNERDYNYKEFPTLAPNNYYEYAVLDNESIAMESGVLIEESFSFEDLSPFSEDDNEITDDDRIKSADVGYKTTVKRLKNSRRKYSINLEITPLPSYINVGDRIKFIYDNELLIMNECSNYLRKILSISDWFYLTKLDRVFSKNNVERDRVTLELFLRVEREGKY